MNKWLKRVLLSLLIFPLALLFVLVVGYFTDEKHVASLSVQVDCTPSQMWALIANFEDHPSWREDLEKVERVADQDGCAVYKEHNHMGEISYKVVEQQPPHRMLTEIVDNEDFGGQWELLIKETDKGCLVTVTESGEVYNLVFRVLGTYVFGFEFTIKGYLDRVQAAGNKLAK